MVKILYKLNALRKASFQARVCAAVINKRGIVDVGFNSEKTHPKQKSLNGLKPYLHAEVEAILRAGRVSNLDKCAIVVVRTKKSGPFGFDIPGASKPCDSCMKFIRMSGIRVVYYLDEEGVLQKLVF